jgi:hypothetical protein
MTDKGRHASDGGSAFYRDLAMMILGIVLVGAAVFFVLFLIADDEGSASTTTADTGATSTSAGQSTITSEGSTSSTSTSTTSTSTTVPVRPPEEVRVVVLNSIDLSGAAGRMTEQLDDAGYQTLPADDYEPEQNPSRLWYREGFSAEANELLEFLPAARVEALPDDSLAPGADVVMILGTGYEE